MAGVRFKKTVLSVPILGLFCMQNVVAAPLDGLVKSLSKGASSLKTKKVAVLAFPYHDGKISSGSSLVSERITTGLVGRKGIRVIERRLIEQLLSEKKLSETGIVSHENLKAIGSVLDADAIVTGTLIDLNNGKTEINARMIKADSGEVLSAAQDSISRTWRDVPMDLNAKKPASWNPRPVPANLEDHDPNLMAEEEAAASVITEPPANKKMMRLSNESFPPSRRIYHGNEAAKPKKKPLYPSYREPEDRGGSYEDGYADAFRDSLMNQRGGVPEPSEKPYSPPPPAATLTPSYSQPTQRTIQHPTQIGVTRSEPSSGSGSYSKPIKKYR